jgi:hypothetical protein
VLGIGGGIGGLLLDQGLKKGLFTCDEMVG